MSFVIVMPSTFITALFASFPAVIPIPPLPEAPPLASVDTLSSSALSLVITKSLPAPLTLEVRTNFDSVPVFIIFAVTPKLSSESLIASRKSANVAPASRVRSKLLSPAANDKVPPEAVTTSSVDVNKGGTASFDVARLP